MAREDWNKLGFNEVTEKTGSDAKKNSPTS